MRLPALQFLRYAGVGAIGTAAHYATLITFVQTGLARPLLATSAGFALGAGVNYALNYRYTFGSDQPHLAALPRFLAVASCGAGLNYAIVWIGLHALGWHYLVAQVAATATVLSWTYSVNRLWTFRRRTATGEPRMPQ